MFVRKLSSVFSFLTLTLTSLSLLPINGAAMTHFASKNVAVGDYVHINTYKSHLNLRNAPCGSIVGHIASMSVGKVFDDAHNNHQMSCNGGTWTWVRVDFANASGFVAAEYLLKHEADKKEAPKMEMPKIMTPRFTCADGYIHTGDACVIEPTKSTHHGAWMTGSKIWVDTVMVPVQVRATPCGNRVGLAWPKVVGTLLHNEKNFVSATCNGGTFTWVEVHFDNGTHGWIASQYLKSSVAHI